MLRRVSRASVVLGFLLTAFAQKPRVTAILLESTLSSEDQPAVAAEVRRRVSPPRDRNTISLDTNGLSAVAVWDAIAAALPDPTPDSNSPHTVLLIGALPDLPPNLHPYARSRFATLSTRKQLSLSAWHPSLEPPAWLALDGVETLPTSAALPSFESYSKLLSATEAASLSTASAPELKALLDAIPADPDRPESLDTGAALATRLNDHRTAATLLERLKEKRTNEPALLRRYAFALYQRGPIADAEPALREADALNPGDPLILERLGRCRLAAKDLDSALALFTRSLDLNPKNETLHWIRADLARDLRKPVVETEALTRALALNPSRLDRRARLLSLLLDAGQSDQARVVIGPVWQSLPAELPVLAEFAGFWERIGEPDNALTLWKKAIGTVPTDEPAYLNAVRILRSRKHDEQALAMVRAGLDRIPSSAPLHLQHSGILFDLRRFQEARAALALPVASSKDASLLAAYAASEAAYGNPDLTAAAPTHPKPADSDPAAGALVPGGIEALAFVAKGKRNPTPSTFFLDYARTVVQHLEVTDLNTAEAYRDSISGYFAKVARLRSFGKTDKLTTRIPLSVSTKPARKKTEDILEFLGYRLKASKKGISVDPGEKEKQGRRQEILSALGIDEVAMESDLEEGKNHTLEFDDSIAPVLFTESEWKRNFYPKATPPGGFAEALASELRLAKTYVGLAAAGPRAAELLVRTFTLPVLVRQYADRLYLYGSALSLDFENHPILPGGDRAIPVWKSLTGIDPTQGGSFLHALLTQRDGRILAWFSHLGQLTPERQRFFTLYPERTRYFYDLFAEAPEFKNGVEKRVRESPLLDFMEHLPVDPASGSVRFPGSPEVWQVAKGASDLDRIGKMMTKVSRAEPAIEDQILGRLARERYTVGINKLSQLENFLSVVAIDARRETPLTPVEALILSQQFAGFEGAYPYFMALTAVGEKELRSFFKMASTIASLSDVDSNLFLGHFHGVTRILSIAASNGAIPQRRAALLFGQLCDGLLPEQGKSRWTAVSARVLRDLVGEAKPQAFLERVFFGESQPLRIPALPGLEDLASSPFDPAQLRIDEFRKILNLQKCPSLDVTLEAAELAIQLAKSPAGAAAIAARLEPLLAALPVLEIPKNIRLRGEQRESVESFNFKEPLVLVRQIREKAAKKKPNPRDFEKLSAEALERLSAPLQLSLAGAVYGYYLRTSDLVVSEDPFLVRKHQYVELDRATSFHTHFPAPSFNAKSEELGSNAVGSMAGMASLAGDIATSAGQHGGRFGEHIQAAQYGALRAAPLRFLTEADLRVFHLTVLAARDWILQSPGDPGRLKALHAAAQGRLTPDRIAAIRDALEQSDWPAVWSRLSVSDLYWLGRQAPMPEKLKPFFEAALPLSSPRRLDALGNLTLEETGSDVPRLEPQPPYEEYANFLILRRFAQRLAEFKFSLALYADRHGIPPAALDVVAGILLPRVLQSLEMADLRDWPSVLQTWEKVR